MLRRDWIGDLVKEIITAMRAEDLFIPRMIIAEDSFVDYEPDTAGRTFEGGKGVMVIFLNYRIERSEDMFYILMHEIIHAIADPCTQHNIPYVYTYGLFFETVELDETDMPKPHIYGMYEVFIETNGELPIDNSMDKTVINRKGEPYLMDKEDETLMDNMRHI